MSTYSGVMVPAKAPQKNKGNNNNNARPKRSRKARKPKLPKSERKAIQANQLAGQVKKLQKAQNDTVTTLTKQVDVMAGCDKRLVMKYLKTLLMPDRYESGIPIGGSHKSAIVTCTQEFRIYANYDQATKGRFAALFQPTPGAMYETSVYANAILDGTQNPYPTNGTDPNSFVQLQGSNQVPLIQNYDEMFAQPPQYTRYFSGGQDNCSMFGPTGTPQKQSDSNFNIGYFQTGTASSTPMSSNFILPEGNWLLDISGSWESDEWNDTDTIVISTTSGSANVTASIQELFLDNEAYDHDGVSFHADVIVVVKGNPGVNDSFVSITFPRVDQLVSSGGDVTSDCQIIVTPWWGQFVNLQTPLIPSLDAGLVTQLRPVAMSVVATCLLDSMHDGGEICVALLGPGQEEKNFFTNNAADGSGWFGDYNNLVNLEESFSGKLSKGCSGFYAPLDNKHVEYQRVKDLLEAYFPTICVAGVATTAATSGNVQVLRILKTVVLEIITSQKFIAQKRRGGSAASFDCAMRAIREFPMVGENGTHIENAKKFLQQIGKYLGMAVDFYKDNSSAINAVGGAVLKMLL